LDNWRHKAKCRGVDTELFISRDNEPSAVTQDNEQYVIREYCTGCPVRIECLTWSETQRTRMHGVWGGLTEQERLGKKKPGTTVHVPRATRKVAKALKEQAS
jgi:WhiB family redox-sensing transcriptional regulator